ncbi:unnamed protein product [Clavelina lepadiformis]|uniref:Lysozyme g n=1 Tax=Clavelina lepadiformis TaxID=159417 RepID=A0ABP0GMZ5_CLALP
MATQTWSKHVASVRDSNGCYGDIMDVDTTGASEETASQDGLSAGNLPVIVTFFTKHKTQMAATDLSAMAQYKPLIEQAASNLCVDPAVIAGIISRETRAGKAIKNSNGYGSDGHGYGLMQVDDRYHQIQGGPYSLDNIMQGTQILIDMINGVQSKHRDWTQDMDLKGGICAYNSGVSNVQTYDNMDVGTTGNDYSNDVTARAQYYKENECYHGGQSDIDRLVHGTFFSVPSHPIPWDISHGIPVGIPFPWTSLDIDKHLETKKHKSSIDAVASSSRVTKFCTKNCNTNFGGVKRRGKNNVIFKLK